MLCNLNAQKVLLCNIHKIEINGSGKFQADSLSIAYCTALLPAEHMVLATEEESAKISC